MGIVKIIYDDYNYDLLKFNSFKMKLEEDYCGHYVISIGIVNSELKIDFYINENLETIKAWIENEVENSIKSREPFVVRYDIDKNYIYIKTSQQELQLNGRIEEVNKQN